MAIFGPKLGRTTVGVTGDALLRVLNQQNQRIEIAGQQLSTGRRIGQTSYDALGSSNWLDYTALTRRNTQYQKNAEDLKQRYNFTDSQLGEAADIVDRLKQIAVREANDGGADASTRRAAADEVAQLRQALLSIANADFSGQNIFGGRKLNGTAFEAVGSAIKYLGTNDVNRVQIGSGVELEAAVDARDIFGVRTNAITGKRDLNALPTLAITSPPTVPAVSTSLSQLNGGRGVDTDGTITIEVVADPATGAKRVYTADVSHAETLQDVIVALNEIRDENGAQVFDVNLFSAASQSFPQNDENIAGGITLQVRAGGPLDGGVLQPGSTIRISDEVGHTTARDLGLLTASSSHTFGTNEDINQYQPFTGPYAFDLKVNGNTIPIAVPGLPPPPFPQDPAVVEAALEAAINATLAGAGIDNVSVVLTLNAADGTVEFTVDDSGMGGYFALEPTNDAAAELMHLDLAASISGPNFSLGAVSFSTDEGVLGRDLDPDPSFYTRLSDLFGGEGLSLETDASGNVRTPQGMRITNGSLSAVVDLATVIQKQDATLADLKHAIERAGVEVEVELEGANLKIVSLLSGTAVKIDDFNGTLATQLGIATNLPDSRIDDLNGGLGIDRIEGAEFTLTSVGGQAVEVDLGEGATAQSIADAINQATDNQNGAGTPPTWFTATVARQRTFDSQIVADPTLAYSFDVSFNGEPAQTISIPASGGRTLATFAAELETALNDAIHRAGLDGGYGTLDGRYSVAVEEDTGGFLRFTVEDAEGTARIAFDGADAVTLGLNGVVSTTDGEVKFLNEAVSDRLFIVDNTFDPTGYSAGDPTPSVSQTAGAGTMNDLGLSGSFDPVTGRFVSTDLAPRGQGGEGVFNALADLLLALQENSASAIGRGIGRMQTALDAVLDGRSESGSRVRRLDLAYNRLDVENSNLNSLASDVMDVDMAQAAQDFQEAQNILQAGLAVTARIAQVSVLDFL